MAMTELMTTSTSSSGGAVGAASSIPAAHSKLAQALLCFEALDQQQQQPNVCMADVLDSIQELTRLLAETAVRDDDNEDNAVPVPVLSRELHASVVAIVKTVCRRVTAHISSVASSSNEEIAAFLRLDNDVTPAFELLAAFTGLELELAAARRPHSLTEREAADADTRKELRRWMPFVLFACAYVACEQLPAAESMRAHAVTETVLARCEALTRAPSRAALLSQFVAPLVALSSQSCSKHEWVDRQSFPKHALRWVVLQVPFPHLGGDLLGRVLALVFPLIDDLSDATQLVGAHMLRHVVRNVTATELRWYSDVLLEVLRRAITSRAPETLSVLLETLTVALDTLSPPGDGTHFDAFVPRLLTDTSLSSDVAIRILYVRHLRPVIARMGAPHSIHIIRYLQPLLKVLVAGFESIHVPLLLETLETLRVTIRSAWPRIAAHAEEIFVGVMRAVAFCVALDTGGTQSTSASDREQILALCEDVLVLLHELSAVVPDMLCQVASQSSVLQPFCESMTTKLLDARGE